ncbi:MAG: pyruvate formate-lyase-activating protein [Erysipelotrichaceae bacterium]
MQGKIHSIETFGTVDGPGIRFVLFLQGCKLRCLYCHNPDTWNTEAGSAEETDAIVKKVMKYKSYLKSGGVTVSGGEALLQLDFLIELFEKLKAAGFHTALDTSGAPFEEDDATWMPRFERLMNATDLVLLDLKHSDEAKHIALTGFTNRNSIALAKYLSKINKPTWIRYVLVPGINDDETSLYEMRELIKALRNVEKVELLPYHKMGISKYQELKIPYRLLGVEPPSAESIAKAKAILKGEWDDRH